MLEEHGHCEVPAGCGGVVLRWTNPNRAIPVEFWLETSGETTFYLDGTPPISGRPMVEYGVHVLGFRISQPDAVSGVLMFAGFYDEKEMTHTGLSRTRGNKVYILSADDGSWKYTTSVPEDDLWMMPNFDDSNWKPMIQRDFPKPNERDPGWYRFKKLTEFGARGLGVSVKADCLWIRKIFSLSRT